MAWHVVWSALWAFIAGLVVSVATASWPVIGIVAGVVFALSVVREIRYDRKPEAVKLRNVWRGNGDERRRRLRPLSRRAYYAAEAGAIAVAAALLAGLSFLPDDDGDTSWLSFIAAFFVIYSYASTVLLGVALRRLGALPNLPDDRAA